jgi:tRNA modification GTPase
VLLDKLPPHLDTLIVFNKCDLSGVPSGPCTVENRKALRISAALDHGLPELRRAIREAAGLRETSEGLFSARARHLDALRLAQAHLHAASERIASRQTAELAAEELRLAQGALGEITGQVTTEDLLGAVFSRFCIGK